MDKDEKKELIFQSYKKTFDKEMAYTKVGLSLDECSEFDEDEEFQRRLELVLIDERERVVNNLKEFMDAEDEKIAYKATSDFLELVYPDFFKNKNKPKEMNLNVNPGKNDPEEDARIEREYGELLQDPGKFVDSKITKGNSDF